MKKKIIEIGKTIGYCTVGEGVNKRDVSFSHDQFEQFAQEIEDAIDKWYWNAITDDFGDKVEVQIAKRKIGEFISQYDKKDEIGLKAVDFYQDLCWWLEEEE